MLLARDLAHDVRSGRLTPLDLVDMCDQAIAAQDAQVRAFAVLDLAAARAAAQAPGQADRPLAGLPFAVKDILDTRELPSEYNSPIYAGHRPASDAPVVSQARRGGGVLLGKTVTTEFAFLEPSITRNPRRLSHTPGGSSAGSAAAVAAGMVPLALGTQTGGSVIRPASYCGVTGYKPTFRILPTLGMKTFSWHLDTIGLFGARVQDVAFAAAGLTGRDLDIGTEVAQAPRIAVIRTVRADQADADAHGALDQAARALAAAGAHVSEVALPPELEAADAIHSTIQDYEGAIAFADEYDRMRHLLSPLLARYLEQAAKVQPDAYDSARRTAKHARHRLGDFFADYDAILTFSAPGTAPEGYGTTGSAIFNRLWTLMGTPTVNVTGLSGANGMPMGVQIVGRFGRDRTALTVAALAERAIQS
ncbi:amidase [Roseixanthobacter glucoisosaccharinicivorans]|uniref:amidase n=1 Tax=Roseixanthobacter glucoisosaccharinicivorans TaxID=3119923 RepID=UPI0037271168